VFYFSDVRCGQLHCRDSGSFRLSVDAGVSILSQSIRVSGGGIVTCRYEKL